MKPPGTKGLRWSKGNESDGYQVVGSKEGGWSFREGRKMTGAMKADLTRSEIAAIDAAAKKWGVKGFGVTAKYTEVSGVRFY
jgi:hypothetical protein